MLPAPGEPSFPSKPSGPESTAQKGSFLRNEPDLYYVLVFLPLQLAGRLCGTL